MDKKDIKIQSESSIQQKIVQWYRNNYCLKHHNPRSMIFSIPNESNGSRAMKLIQTGLYPGAADLMVIHQREAWRKDYDGESVLVGYNSVSVFVECKAREGVQSEKQKEFEVHAYKVGASYRIVRSLDEFKQVIENL